VFGTSVGIIGGLCGGLSGVIGPFLLGYLYDITGSFFWGFVALGVGTLIGALALIPVVGYEKRIKQEKAMKQASLASPILSMNEAAPSHS
jgi:MFS family permease